MFPTIGKRCDSRNAFEYKEGILSPSSALQRCTLLVRSQQKVEINFTLAYFSRVQELENVFAIESK